MPGTRSLSISLMGCLILTELSMGQTEFTGTRYDIPLPDSTIVVHRMEAEVLTDQPRPDMVLLADVAGSTELWIYFAIGQSVSPRKITELGSETPLDFTIWHGPEFNQIVVSTNSGLKFLRWDDPSGSFLVTAPLTDSRWNGATQISTVDWNTGMGEGFLGVAANGRQVIRSYFAGGWSTSSIYWAQSDVQALHALQWNDVTAELDVLTLHTSTSGIATLEFRNVDGSPLGSFVASDTLNLLEPIPGYAGNEDGVFWVTEGTPGNYVAITMSHTTLEPVQALGTNQVADVAVVQWTADAHPDLAISFAHEDVTHIYTGDDPSNPTQINRFNPVANPETTVLPSFVPSSGPHLPSAEVYCRKLLVGDFDTDGDDDLMHHRVGFAGGNNTFDLWMSRGRKVIEEDLALIPEVATEVTLVEGGISTVFLHFTAPALGADAHYQIAMWECSSVANPVLGNAPLTIIEPMPIPAGGGSMNHAVLFPTALNQTGVYQLQINAIDWNATNQEIRQYYSSVTYWLELADASELITKPNPWPQNATGAALNSVVFVGNPDPGGGVLPQPDLRRNGSGCPPSP